MYFPTREVLMAAHTLLNTQLLPTRSFITTDDELVNPLGTALRSCGQFTAHESNLRILSTEDVKAALLILQALYPGLHQTLKSKAGPEFGLLFTATTQTTYDMIELVYSRLAAERQIGCGSLEEFVGRVAAYAGVPAGNQSLFNQVMDSLELLRQLGEEVPNYLLEEAVMV